MEKAEKGTMSDMEITYDDVRRVVASIEPFDYTYRDNGPGQYPSSLPIKTRAAAIREAVFRDAVTGEGAAAVAQAVELYGPDDRPEWEYVARVGEWFKDNPLWSMPDGTDLFDVSAWLSDAATGP